MSKARIFWPILALLVLADCTTKEVAVERLSPPHTSHEVLGSLLRLTLVYNPGTAFGVDLRPYLGGWARPVLIVGVLAILVFLTGLYRRTAPTARALTVALALVCGGALGNLLDRLRYSRGVVDFIDVGVGVHRFWTFNIADVAITMGALLLALILSPRTGQTGSYEGS